MTKNAIKINLLLALLLLPGLAFAEEDASVASQYAKAESVFIGSLERKPDVSNEYTAIFRVLQSIKGQQKEISTVAVKTPADTRCAYIEDGEYLVYAIGMKDGLWADPCKDSKHISLAESDLQYIHTVNSKVSPRCSPKRLRKLAAKSNIIARGEVVNVKPHQVNCWSGTLICMADVTYDIKQVLKGNVKDEQIVVEHVLVSNSLTADVNMDVPRLSPTLFRKGNVLLLFLEAQRTTRHTDGTELISEGVRYFDEDENCGAITPDAAAGLKIARPR